MWQHVKQLHFGQLPLFVEKYTRYLFLGIMSSNKIRLACSQGEVSLCLGRGGGQMVSALAFHSDDLRSNPAESTVFILKLV